MRIEEALELFMAHRTLKGCTDETLGLYRRQVEGWQTWRAERQYSDNLAEVVIEDFREYFLYLKTDHIPHGRNPRRPPTERRGLKPESQDTAWRILRSFWLYLDREGKLSDEQKLFFVNDRLPRPKISRRARPFCDEATFDALMKAAGTGHDEESARNRAIVSMLFESGIRVAEVCDLTDEQTKLDERESKVIAKGDRERFVFWGAKTAAALRRYLLLRRGDRGGPLFRGVSSRNNGNELTPDAVRGMIKRLGVELPEGSPVHFIRHGFAHAALDTGLDITQVQQLMDHASVTTTQRYTRERPDKLKELHQRVVTPRRGKPQRKRDEEHEA